MKRGWVESKGSGLSWHPTFTYTLTDAGRAVLASTPTPEAVTVTLYAWHDGTLCEATALVKPNTYRIIEGNDPPWPFGYGDRKAKDEVHLSPEAALSAAHARASSLAERLRRGLLDAEADRDAIEAVMEPASGD